VTSGEMVLPMIVGTALLTFGIRYLPIVLLGGRRLRPLLKRFLQYLPIGILSALVAQSTFLRGGVLNTGISDYYRSWDHRRIVAGGLDSELGGGGIWRSGAGGIVNVLGLLAAIVVAKVFQIVGR